MLFDTNLISQWLRAPTSPVGQFLQGTPASRLTVSAVTAFELSRGVEELRLNGQGRKLQVRLAKFLDSVTVFQLTAGIWSLATETWAKGRVHKPAIVFTDADLLIACTAAYHRQMFLTGEGRLIANLKKLSFECEMMALPIAQAIQVLPTDMKG